jgi:diaminopimelate decarboxylase
MDTASKRKYLDPVGVSVHIGSQITDVEPFGAAAERVASLAVKLRGAGINIRYVDAGGGLGVSYRRDALFHPAKQVSEYARVLRSALSGLDIHLLLEPGRFLVGNAGVLITKVLFVKRNRTKTFVVVDTAMNDLLRPALIGAQHEVLPLSKCAAKSKTKRVDVVGPVCESGDFLARDCKLRDVQPGEYLAILDVGAYGLVLSSNYNSRRRPAEVLVQEKEARVIRKRECFADLIRLET